MKEIMVISTYNSLVLNVDNDYTVDCRASLYIENKLTFSHKLRQLVGDETVPFKLEA